MTATKPKALIQVQPRPEKATDLLKFHLKTLLSSQLPSLRSLKSLISAPGPGSNNQIDLSELLSALESLTNIQIASVPQDRAIGCSNYPASLILAELQDWLDSFVDKRQALSEFREMVDNVASEVKLTDDKETRWWREVQEQLSIAD